MPIGAFKLNSIAALLASSPPVSYTSTSMAVTYGASPYIIIYNRSGDTYTKVSNPATLPTGQTNGASWNNDGTSLAVAHNTTPYVTIYNRSGDTFTKVTNPGTLPTGNAEEIAWNPAGTSLAVAHGTTPFVTIYNRSGDTFTKISNPGTLPTGTCIGIGWNPAGTSLAVGHQVSPFVTIYNRSGDTFTKISNPGTLPTSQATSIAWNNDGTSLAVAIDNTTQKFFVYNRSGDTFTKISDPATMPAGVCNGIAWNPAGTSLAIAHDTSPYVTIYNRSGDTLTKITNPGTLPTGNAISVAWDAEGTRLTVTHATTPYVTIYNRSGDTFTKVTNPADLPSGTTEDVSWNSVVYSPPSTAGWVTVMDSFNPAAYGPTGIDIDSTGSIYVSGTVGSYTGMFLWKFLSTGALDWVKKIAPTSSLSNSYNVHIDSADSITMIGQNNPSSNNYYSVVSRYDTSGTESVKQYVDLNTSTGTTGIDIPNDLYYDSTNGLYVGGQTYAFNSTYPGAFIVKLNNTATTMTWYRTLTRTSEVLFTGQVLKLSSGNIVVTGYGYPTSNLRYNWCAVYNSSGTIQSQQKLSSASASLGHNWSTVDSSDNIIIVAADQGGGGLLIKRSSSNVLTFQKSLTHTSGSPVFESVTTDTSGNIFVSGYINVGTDIPLYIWKYDSSGVLQWAKQVGTTTTADVERLSKIIWKNSFLYITARNITTSKLVIIKLPDSGGTDGSYGTYTLATATGFTEATATNTEAAAGLTSTTRTVVTTIGAYTGATTTPTYTASTTSAF